MTQLLHLIEGSWRAGSGREQVDVNPARPEEVVASYTAATPQDVSDVVAAARGAFTAWADTPFHERAAVLARAAALLHERANALGAELTREEGKTLPEAVGEVRRASDIFRFYSAEANRETGELFASPRRNETILVVRRPIGVVTIITPWNFPVAIPAWKIAPALVYGNAVIWKPASLVPLLAYRMTQVLEEAGVPPGVLSLVIGGGSIGQQLVEDPGVDAVSFTGSTGIGRSLIATCGLLAKPIQTEMGGKNAAIILRDADLPAAVDQVLSGAMRSTGQKCTATSRLIVEDAVANDVLEDLRQKVARLNVGDGMLPDIDMGPAASEEARDSILAQVDQARRAGAEVLIGAEPYGDERANGYFVPPTVLVLADRDTDIWREEVFGPVLSVVRAKDAQESLDLANDSRFGLAGSLFTNDLRVVLQAIDRFEAGVLHINSETSGADPHVPFGGLKESGSGAREQGRAAREFYTHSKTVYLRPLG